MWAEKEGAGLRFGQVNEVETRTPPRRSPLEHHSV